MCPKGTDAFQHTGLEEVAKDRTSMYINSKRLSFGRKINIISTSRPRDSDKYLTFDQTLLGYLDKSSPSIKLDVSSII